MILEKLLHRLVHQFSKKISSSKSLLLKKNDFGPFQLISIPRNFRLSKKILNSKNKVDPNLLNLSLKLHPQKKIYRMELSG